MFIDVHPARLYSDAYAYAEKRAFHVASLRLYEKMVNAASSMRANTSEFLMFVKDRSWERRTALDWALGAIQWFHANYKIPPGVFMYEEYVIYSGVRKEYPDLLKSFVFFPPADIAYILEGKYLTLAEVDNKYMNRVISPG